MQTGANDVYVIDSISHGEVLLPAIRECVRRVDVEEGKMTVRLNGWAVIGVAKMNFLYYDTVSGNGNGGAPYQYHRTGGKQRPSED